MNILMKMLTVKQTPREIAEKIQRLEYRHETPEYVESLLGFKK